MEEACDNCLEKEVFEYRCNECDHEWKGVGLQMRCPDCNSTALQLLGMSKVEAVRLKKLERYIGNLGTVKPIKSLLS